MFLPHLRKNRFLREIRVFSARLLDQQEQVNEHEKCFFVSFEQNTLQKKEVRERERDKQNRSTRQTSTTRTAGAARETEEGEQ